MSLHTECVLTNCGDLWLCFWRAHLSKVPGYRVGCGERPVASESCSLVGGVWKEGDAIPYVQYRVERKSPQACS